VDGDGGFQISVIPKSRNNLGYQVGLTFYVSSGKGTNNGLTLIQKLLGGSLVGGISSPNVNLPHQKVYSVRIWNVIGSLIGYFNRFPIYTSRAYALAIWIEVYAMMCKGYHHTKKG
jgi:hypothetical protein